MNKLGQFKIISLLIQDFHNRVELIMNRREVALMVHFLFAILLTGCQINEPIDELNTTSSHIVIMPLQDDFLIGEGAVFSINIQNNQDIPIDLLVPLRFHLVAPNGEDIYPQTNLDDVEPQAKMITIDSQSTKRIPFGIPSHVNLLQLGSYTLWMEADDRAGNSYKSNDAVFNVIEKEYDVSSENINLMISSNHAYKLDDTLDFQIRFTNFSDKPLTFLKPQEGSFLGWRYPMYLLIITDQDGNNLEYPGSEAVDDPVYSPDTMFTIQAGETYQFTDTLPRFSGLDHSGIYKIQLIYVVRDQEKFFFWEPFSSGDAFQPEPINWDEDVFLGHIMSNEITITIEE